MVFDFDWRSWVKVGITWGIIVALLVIFIGSILGYAFFSEIFISTFIFSAAAGIVAGVVALIFAIVSLLIGRAVYGILQVDSFKLGAFWRITIVLFLGFITMRVIGAIFFKSVFFTWFELGLVFIGSAIQSFIVSRVHPYIWSQEVPN